MTVCINSNQPCHHCGAHQNLPFEISLPYLCFPKIRYLRFFKNDSQQVKQMLNAYTISSGLEQTAHLCSLVTASAVPTHKIQTPRNQNAQNGGSRETTRSHRLVISPTRSHRLVISPTRSHRLVISPTRSHRLVISPITRRLET